ARNRPGFLLPGTDRRTHHRTHHLAARYAGDGGPRGDARSAAETSMSNHAQPAAIAATAIVSIAIGYGAATWLASTRVEDKPIINPTAWEETAPAPQVHTVSYTNTAQGDGRAAAHCSPWEVSDIAMEE